MGRTDWFVLRRQGCLWGVPGDRVGHVANAEEGYRVQVGEWQLVADEVLRVHLDLTVRPAGPVVRAVTPEGCSGLGLCEHGPLVVIDPDRPPAILTVTEKAEGVRDGS